MTEIGEKIFRVIATYNNLNPAIIHSILNANGHPILYKEFCQQLMLLRDETLNQDVASKIKQICNYGGLL